MVCNLTYKMQSRILTTTNYVKLLVCVSFVVDVCSQASLFETMARHLPAISGTFHNTE